VSLDYEKKLARECVHAALKSEVRATTKGGLAMSPTVHSSCVLVLSTRAPKKWNSQAINEYIQVLLSHYGHWEASRLRKADVGIRAERPGMWGAEYDGMRMMRGMRRAQRSCDSAATREQ
jgi:hypothetical protein